MSRSPQLSAFLAAAAVAVAVAGCGGSNGAAGPGSSAQRAATAVPASASRGRIVPADGGAAPRLSPRQQYAAFARAVNLAARDAPAGFFAQPRSGHLKTQNAALEPGASYKHCVPQAEAKPVFERKSPNLAYQRRLQSVSFGSEVEVGRSAAAMDSAFAHMLRAIDDAATRGCLQRAFDALGAHAGPVHVAGHRARITVGGLELVPMHLPRPAAGLTRSEGFSMSLSVLYTVYGVRGHTIRLPLKLYFDGLTFGVGRAQVSLTATGVGSMFPPSLEQAKYDLLVSRALAALRAYPAIA